MRRQRGVTLVELVVAIVVIAMAGSALIGTLSYLAGTSGTTMRQAQAQGCANGAAGGVNVNGTQIIFANGWPNNASIRALLQSTEGFNTNAAGNQMIRRGGANNNCFVQYNQAAAGAEPTISYQGGARITDQATENAVMANLRAAC